jgi:hypothetical protein
MERRGFSPGVLLALVLLLAPPGASAQTQMPDLKTMSGVPLPAADLPRGTVSVRIIRGSLDRNLASQPVEFVVDGRKETRRTDESGRTQIEGLKPGAKVVVIAVVDGERLESQEITLANSGIRLMLVATDPEAAARAEEDRKLAAAPAVKGMVVFGPESRIIARMNDDRLTIFYVLHIMNSARVPVDPGGPLILDLPREARGAAVLEESSTKATVNGPRVVVTSPFPPGVTPVQIAFELPYSGPTARLEQTWPANLQVLNVLVIQIGGLDVVSPQIKQKQEITDQGERLIVAGGSTIPAGQSLTLEITGLPHHARWPRYVALTLAGAISLLGIWAAAVARPRSHAA